MSKAKWGDMDPDEQRKRKAIDLLAETRAANNGEYPAYAWPGGYPTVYVMSDGGILCPNCANGKNGSEARPFDNDNPTSDGWEIIGLSIHYEGPAQVCEHCSKSVETERGTNFTLLFLACLAACLLLDVALTWIEVAL